MAFPGMELLCRVVKYMSFICPRVALYLLRLYLTENQKGNGSTRGQEFIQKHWFSWKKGTVNFQAPDQNDWVLLIQQ